MKVLKVSLFMGITICKRLLVHNIDEPFLNFGKVLQNNFPVIFSYQCMYSYSGMWPVECNLRLSNQIISRIISRKASQVDLLICSILFLHSDFVGDP